MSSYLRTRYRALHNRFGTAGVVVAVIALVVALSGTALAASGATVGQRDCRGEADAGRGAGDDENTIADLHGFNLRLGVRFVEFQRT